MFKEVLQGKPIRHPLHPILIHFPIGLFLLGLVLDVAGLIEPNNVMVRGAFYALGLGVLTAFLAAATGLADWSSIRDDHPARQTANLHLLLNLTAVGLYIISLALRYGELDARHVGVAPFVLSVIAIAILAFSGYLGGKMVYEDGIAVGRHRHAGDLPQRTIRAAAPVPDRWVPVADLESLPEGQTLRVEVDGTVMTLTRRDGQLYAFQEFCTHRCGPLSEGCLHGDQIICPWHGSAFDVRTGRVVHGPAKIDLRTFEAAARDGKIYIRVPSAVAAGERQTA